MTKPKTGATSKKGKTTKRRMLEVEDADSVKEFLVQARAVWNESHPFRRENRGRPSVLAKVIWTIDRARLAGKLGGKPSQGKMIRVVQDILQKDVENQPGKSAPSADAIRPYVKVWHMAKFKGRDGLTAEDEEWLDKRNGTFLEIFEEILGMPEDYP